MTERNTRKPAMEERGQGSFDPLQIYVSGQSPSIRIAWGTTKNANPGRVKGLKRKPLLKYLPKGRNDSYDLRELSGQAPEWTKDLVIQTEMAAAVIRCELLYLTNMRRSIQATSKQRDIRLEKAAATLLKYRSGEVLDLSAYVS